MKRKKGFQSIYFKFTLLMLLILTITLLSFTLKGQTIERQLIGSTGNLSETTNFQVSATSGEIAISTETSGTIILTQGFQQPLPEDFVSSINIDNSDIEIAIYPNPTISSIKLDLKSNTKIDFNIQVLNINGNKIVQNRKLSFSGKTSEIFDFNHLPPNTYILLIKNKKGKVVKSFEVIKQ